MHYREFQLGSDVASIAKLIGIAPSDVKLIHQRPAVMQDVEWRPRYFSRGASAQTDPVELIVFRFYDDQLFRVVVDYDRDRTEGMTEADMIEAITAEYGPASRLLLTSNRIPTLDYGAADTPDRHLGRQRVVTHTAARCLSGCRSGSSLPSRVSTNSREPQVLKPSGSIPRKRHSARSRVRRKNRMKPVPRWKKRRPRIRRSSGRDHPHRACPSVLDPSCGSPDGFIEKRKWARSALSGWQSTDRLTNRSGAVRLRLPVSV